jgi:O-methyltransferase
MHRRSRWYRRGPGSTYRALASLRFLFTRDRRAALAFLAARWPRSVPLVRRLGMLAAFVRCTNAVRGYHTLAEILTVCDRILRRAGSPDLTVVECGTGKGASTAKLSLAVREAGGRLLAFDSFRGIPENDEHHVSIDGRRLTFRAGAFAATLPSVRRVIERHGAPEVCTLRKGWFRETLPALEGGVDVALVDVDLLQSTRTCLIELGRRMRAGGTILSHDGHIVAIADLIGDPAFWEREVGVAPPRIEGLGRGKLIELTFDAPRSAQPAG